MNPLRRAITPLALVVVCFAFFLFVETSASLSFGQDDLASSNSQRFVVGEPIEQKWWKPIGPSAPETVLRLFFALRDRSVKEMEEYALQISDPSNQMWGNQLSLEDVRERMAISEEEVSAVVQFLIDNGVNAALISVGNSRSFVRAAAPVSIFEKILQCKFFQHQHVSSTNSREIVNRCLAPSSLPSSLEDIVTAVEPVHGFSRHTPSSAKKELFSKPIAFDIAPAVTIDLINQRYNITLGKTDQKVNNSQAVWEEQDSYSPSDLQEFFTKYAPQLVGQTVVGVRGDAGNDPSNPDDEPNLDVQIIMGTGAYAPTYYYNYKESDIFNALLKWVDDLSNDPAPPLVHSISWGEYGGKYPLKMVDKISNQFMILGTRGVSILVASGDDGAGCNKNCTMDEFPYPSSPWVTLVGSTNILQKDNGEYYETAPSFSTGGFSSDFTMPQWQKTVVEQYLSQSQYLPPPTFFNASGRALPDLSTAGNNVLIILNKKVVTVGGTSCSAPMFGGMVSLMNGARLQVGKKPLGFLNPLLYQAYANSTANYYDVTVGHNGDGCCKGFKAAPGWDAVTGLGSPNFESLWGNFISYLP